MIDRAITRLASRSASHPVGCLLLMLLVLLTATPAAAFTVNINPGSSAVFLQVGVGSFSGVYSSGGTPQNNPTINVVSVAVPPAAVISGADQQMTSDSTQAISFYDGFNFCVPPNQVYFGGFYRRPNTANQTALLQAIVPAALVSAAGDTIPFSQIRWTSGGAGDGTAAQPVPAGRFINGGVQTIGNFRRNTWNESCLTFFYDNDPVPGGVYEGRVIYTLTVP